MSAVSMPTPITRATSRTIAVGPSTGACNQNDLSRSLVALEQNNTIIAVIEMSLNYWLIAGIVSGVDRHGTGNGALAKT
jgi:hypothetical protein